MANRPISRFRWLLPEGDQAAGSGGDLLRKVLHRRGILSDADIAAFLEPHIEHLNDPSLLPDMALAVERVQRAIDQGEPIAIFGDYDADGVTSTAILTRALGLLGARVRPYLPHRIADGYGLKPAGVDRVAADGASLLIAVDCGTHDHAGLQRAHEHGIDVIVLDHHHIEPTAAPLPLLAFVSPRRPDSRYPFAALAAAGLAYQFVRALADDDFAARFLPLAALGTVADVVPLISDNRVIVHHGLERFACDGPVGLNTLAATAGVKPAGINAWHLAYVLGPRINAAGRVDDPQPALDLLLTDDRFTAAALARRLDLLNVRRQQVTAQMIAEAEEMAARQNGSLSPVLMLAEQNWNVGLVGLVASRLSERYHRPALIFAQGETLSRGSARSIEGFNIVEALADCRDLLVEHGGHSRAAGLTIETSRLDDLQERLAKRFEMAFAGQTPSPTLPIDAELQPHELSLETADLLSALEPCGAGNPAPVFLARSLRPRRLRASRDGKHLMFDVAGPDGRGIHAIFFGGGPRLIDLGNHPRVDLAFQLKRDVWKGRSRLELDVQDFRPAGMALTPDSDGVSPSRVLRPRGET